MRCQPSGTMPFSAVVGVLLVTGAAHAGSNLVINGDAELGDLTGWTDPSASGYVLTADGATVYAGTYSFHGGATGTVGPWTNEIYQDLDVSDAALEIDAGEATSRFRAYARSNSDGGATDHAFVVVEFRDDSGSTIATYDSGGITPVNKWNLVEDTRTVPIGTRDIRIWLRATRAGGASTDGFHDDVWLDLDVTTPVEDTTWGRVKGMW